MLRSSELVASRMCSALPITSEPSPPDAPREPRMALSARLRASDFWASSSPPPTPHSWLLHLGVIASPAHTHHSRKNHYEPSDRLRSGQQRGVRSETAERALETKVRVMAHRNRYVRFGSVAA